MSAVCGVHRHLAEEVPDLRIFHGQGAETVPEIVEHVESLLPVAGSLIFGCHERASEFESVGEIVGKEFLGEIEHVGSGYSRASVGYFHILA